MPVVESSVIVALPVDLAFAVSQTTGSIRKRWDPFIRRQYFLDDAVLPDTGVRTVTVHRLGFRMTSEYVSYYPPTNVGMKMVTGSWFFERMGGGWRFTPVDGQPDSTRVVWKYNFACRPRFLAPLAEWIGRIILQRDVDRRIAGYARGCADPQVIAAARAAAGR